MKIVNLQIENIKKIKAIDITPQGNTVTLSGKNEQGKTTILDSIWMAIGGGKTIPGQPIRKGQTKGKIVLDLGDMIATRKFTESGSTLEVVNKEGLKFPSPQAVLDKLVSRFSFDVQAFAAADSKAQAETLLSIVEIPIDYERLEEISGVKVAPSADPLADINAAYKMVYDDRRIIDRELGKAAVIKDGLPQVEQVGFLVVSDLLDERASRVAHNKKNDLERSKVEALASCAEAWTRNLERNAEDIQGLHSAITELQNELEEKRKIKDSNEVALKAALQDKVKAAKVVAKLVDKDVAEIDAAIRQADDNNRQAQAFERLLAATESHKAKMVESVQVEARLAAIKAYKDELMDQVKFPIEGLGFAKGAVTYQGLPLEQASYAQKMQVSCAIGMAQSPGLQVIRINDRNAFDSEHWAVIEQMAIDNDFQVWSELVDESGQVGIVIEDGTVKEAN